MAWWKGNKHGIVESENTKFRGPGTPVAISAIYMENIFGCFLLCLGQTRSHTLSLCFSAKLFIHRSHLESHCFQSYVYQCKFEI